MTSFALPRSTPSAESIDAEGIRAFVDALESAHDVEPHSIMMMRHGSVVAEGWWAPYSPDRVHLLYSLSKSFTSTAVAFAIEEGLLSLDDTIISHFPEFEADITDPRSRSMKVRHLLAMASGHRDETVERAAAIDPHDLVRGFLLMPPDEEPGSLFCYNQSCTYTLAAIVQKHSGQSLTDYLRPRLFDPLGIGDVAWIQDESGRQLGFSGFHAQTDAVARLGLLYLQGGLWNGERLLSETWVDDATSVHVDNSMWENPDWQQGYGFQFWIARHGYRGDGAYGQFCVVLPEQDVVVAMTGQSIDMQAVLDAAWTHLLPAIEKAGSTTQRDTDDQLAAHLASRSLAPVTADEPDDGDVEPGEFVAAVGNDHETLSAVGVETREGGGWTLTLREGGEPLVVGVGRGDWVVTEAVAASGSVSDGILRVDLIFVETPHRLHLTLDSATSAFEARWETVPLHAGPLRELRSPRDAA